MLGSSGGTLEEETLIEKVSLKDNMISVSHMRHRVGFDAIMHWSSLDQHTGLQRGAVRLYIGQAHPLTDVDILMDVVHHREPGATQLAEMLLSMRINMAS